MMAFDVAQLFPIMPELLLMVGAMVLLVLGAFAGNRATGLITFLAVGLIAGAAFTMVPHLGADATRLFSGLMILDGFSQYAKLLMLGATAMVLMLGYGWLSRHQASSFEFPVLALLSLSGMMIMVSANNFMTLYMGLELSSLALYVLAAFDRDNPISAEAGMKYFVLGSLASGMMLFGSSLIYGFSGSLSFDVIAQLLSSGAQDTTVVSYGMVVGMVLLTVGFCFKISAVPFHMWTPDVYTGAPTAVTLFFATAPKLAAMVLFIRVLNGPFSNMFADWQTIIAFVANASMIIGALGAMMQTNFKRLLAYGSIGHVGYVLVGVAAGSVDGTKAVLLYLSLYLFMSIGTFGFILLMRRNGQYVEKISDLAGLSKTCPAGALFVLLMMFLMAGIPPFAGFFGKMFVFLAAIESGLYVMTVVGLLTSVIAAFYYLKVVKVMYFDDATDALDDDAPFTSRLVLFVCALVTVGFVVYPSLFMDAAALAAQQIG